MYGYANVHKYFIYLHIPIHIEMQCGFGSNSDSAYK